jgi:hypothetical protein
VPFTAPHQPVVALPRPSGPVEKERKERKRRAGFSRDDNLAWVSKKCILGVGEVGPEKNWTVGDCLGESFWAQSTFCHERCTRMCSPYERKSRLERGSTGQHFPWPLWGAREKKERGALAARTFCQGPDLPRVASVGQVFVLASNIFGRRTRSLLSCNRIELGRGGQTSWVSGRQKGRRGRPKL